MTADAKDKLNSADNLHYLLNPRSVAIIGVSRNPDSFGYPLADIALRHGYTGRLYLVNPKADTILGRKCYPSVGEVPGPVDAAVIMVPRPLVDRVIDDCLACGVRGAVIITAGFAEKDAEGRRHQEALAARAAAGGLRLIGPNTLGFYSAAMKLDLLMSGFIVPGRTALLTQSGNLTTSLTFPGAERGLGFSYVIDLGNQADLSAPDFIRYFREDEQTRSIAVHIEGLSDGRRFMEEVRATVGVKPVVVLKSGRTDVGARVVSSHTASLAGDDEVYQAAFRQCGALTVDNFTAFTSTLLALNQDRPAAGNRMCVISEGGGDCALASDACVRSGLAVPELSPASRRRLAGLVPPNGSVHNPVDLAGWENVVEATETALADEGIDGVIVVGGFAGFYHINPADLPREREYVERMCRLLEGADKPVHIYSYFSWRRGELVASLTGRRVPLYLDHHDAVGAMAALVRYGRRREELAGRPFPADPGPPPAGALVPGRAGSLLEPEAKQLLAGYGLPAPAERMAADEEEAVAAAAEIGYPVALKIVSRDILHKTDADGVRLGLDGPAAVREAFRSVVAGARSFNARAAVAGVLVSRMVCEPGVEVIIGGLRDPVFGPVVMFGSGGVMVEALRDIVFRVCPLDEAEARAMIGEIAGYRLLTGFRGRPAVDRQALAGALLAVSRLLVENPGIAELDLNPVRVTASGLLVLDARLVTA